MMKQTEITYQTPKQPNQVRLDTTTSCPASCLSCHRFVDGDKNTLFRKGLMPSELVYEIINDIAKWPQPLQEIVPVNYGEVFAYPDWQETLRFISQKLPKTRIVIPTTGIYFNPETIKKLTGIRTVSIINFSVNAFFEETYKAFCGLPEENLRNIENACKLFRLLRPDIDLRASMVFDPVYQTDLERDLFLNHWKGIVNSTWVLPAASAGRRDKVGSLSPTLPCRSLFSDIVIGFDRKISSCCFDAGFQINCGTYTGNILDNWQGKELTKLRDLHNTHQRSQVKLCSKCTFA